MPTSSEVSNKPGQAPISPLVGVFAGQAWAEPKVATDRGNANREEARHPGWTVDFHSRDNVVNDQAWSVARYVRCAIDMHGRATTDFKRQDIRGVDHRVIGKSPPPTTAVRRAFLLKFKGK